jgi:hypothetical protein
MSNDFDCQCTTRALTFQNGLYTICTRYVHDMYTIQANLAATRATLANKMALVGGKDSEKWRIHYIENTFYRGLILTRQNTVAWKRECNGVPSFQIQTCA